MDDKENKKPQETAEEKEVSILSRVFDYFCKLIEKFTKGKYSTPEEMAFFEDEKNLYDENGQLTPEYKNKIKEFEEYVKSHDVDEFLHEVHSQDSEEFGPAYNENEMAVLDSGLQFVSRQKELVDEIIEEKKRTEIKGIPFDFDKYFRNKLKQEGEDYDEAMQNIREYVIENIEEVSEECPEFMAWLGITIDGENTNFMNQEENNSNDKEEEQ